MSGDRKVKKRGKCLIGRHNNGLGGRVTALTSSRKDVSAQVCFPMIPTCSRGFVEGRRDDCDPTSPNLSGMASLEEQKSQFLKFSSDRVVTSAHFGS